MTVNEKTIFLIDGIGAVVSVLLLGVVLPALRDLIGMPVDILYLMCVVPLVYLVYDACCFWLVNHRDPKWLRAIILANLAYCVVTAILVVGHFGDLTIWGVAYFLAELVVILSLVVYERRVFVRIFETERA